MNDEPKFNIICLNQQNKHLFLVDSQEPGGFGWTTAREQRAKFPLLTALRVIKSLKKREGLTDPLVTPDVGNG